VIEVGLMRKRKIKKKKNEVGIWVRFTFPTLRAYLVYSSSRCVYR